LSRTIEVTSIMGNKKVTPPEVSERLKRESRVSGKMFQEIHDVECAADDCERVFIQRLEGQEYCTRHRTQNQ